MSRYDVSLERIDYLATRIAEMALGEVRISQLGSIAIELLVARERAEEKITGDYSKEEKEEAKKTLEQIKKLEKSIVQLYFLGMMRGEPAKKGHFFEHIMGKYISR